MDLSGLKWPLIIGVVLFIGWLGTSGGVNWMVNNATKAQPGVDAKRDELDEATLTRVGGYLLYLWRYDRAREVMETAIARYGTAGKNYYYNYYRIVACYERVQRYQCAYNVLQELIAMQAWNYDARVPDLDNLSLRASKLKEVHELQDGAPCEGTG